jgi:hypothetical protein
MLQSYSPAARFASNAASFASILDRIHDLNDWSPSDATGALTDQQNQAVRRTLVDAWSTIGGEDAANAAGLQAKSGSVGFSVTATTLTVYAAIA